MKILQIISAAVALFSVSLLQAQDKIPEGYSKGTILLPDSSVITGFVKESFRKSATISFINESGKKTTYAGTAILSTTIGSDNYACVKGDFFKVICNGKLSFLQKMSDASGKPTYYGNDAVFISGTDGKPGDYFLYESKTKELKLVTKKNLTEITSASFAGCNEAIEKSKTISGDLSLLKEAVTVYNESVK